MFERAGGDLEAMPPRPEHQALAEELPGSIRLGTMSWSFPGFRGLLYGPNVNVKRLAEEGLGAYARHPLLSAVEIDRTHYEPLSPQGFQHYAAQVPEGFRFLVKAHEACTIRRFPAHARYGARRGADNPLYLQPRHAVEAVIRPAVEGLGSKLAALLFQFPPHESADPARFAGELHDFLRQLPKGPQYAVELRNRELLSAEYVAALAASGAIHCHNVWSAMPDLLLQVKRVVPAARRPLLVRWLLRPGDAYAAAGKRLAPFDRLKEEDLLRREQIARLVTKATEHEVPAWVLINNTAEGCAPESVVSLAQQIVDERKRRARAPRPL